MIIPFIHQIPDDEVAAWQAEFAKVLPSHPVRELSQLTPLEIEQAELAIVANPDPDSLAAFPNLRWVQSLWAGVEKILDTFPSNTVGIARMVDPALSRTMSEAVLAWVFYLQRSMPHYRANQALGCWAPLAYKSPQEVKITILGMGEMGSQSAKRLADNGFKVVGWSRSHKQLETVRSAVGLDLLLKELADTQILVNLLPLTPDTYRMIDSSLLMQLPKGASVINFGRGPTLNTDDLLAALDANHLEHAILDVFDVEPLNESDPLWRHSGITVLPHISAPTSLNTAAVIASQNIIRYIEQGVTPPFVGRNRGY